jgi:acyl carrier protein
MDKIKEIISNVLKIDQTSITMEMTPDDVESWDSSSKKCCLEKKLKALVP